LLSYLLLILETLPYGQLTGIRTDYDVLHADEGLLSKLEVVVVEEICTSDIFNGKTVLKIILQ
jgi:hypothetical protein